MIAAFFAPYMGKIIEYGIILAVVSGLCVYVKVHYEDIGYNKAITAVATGDKEASDAAAKARAKVVECDRMGGNWDVTNGVCH